MMDACLSEKSFYEALIYEIDIWSKLKKFVPSMSRRKRHNPARNVWLEENYPFIDCYKNGDWVGHVMIGVVAGSDEKIEMIEVENIEYDQDGIEKLTYTERAIYDNPHDRKESDKYWAWVGRTQLALKEFPRATFKESPMSETAFSTVPRKYVPAQGGER